MTTEDVLAKLDPKTRKRLQTAMSVEIHKQKTPSIGLNLALRGGLGYGRQTLVWGNKSAGKTSFALQLVGMAQKEGKTCAWIDAEQSYDPDWAERLGVDGGNLIYSSSRGVAKIADECVELVSSGIDVLVLDSISTVLASSYFSDDEIKPFERTGQIGTQSKDLGKLSNMIMGVNENTLVIFISQQRNAITPTYTQLVPMGGQAIKFNSSTIIKLFSSESDAKALMGDISAGDRIFSEKIGRPVRWEVEFNKLGPMGPEGSYDFYFRGHDIGVDPIGEIVDLAERYGIIIKSGAWYTIGEERIQGRLGVVEYLTKNPAIAEEIEQKIYAFDQ